MGTLMSKTHSGQLPPILPPSQYWCMCYKTIQMWFVVQCRRSKYVWIVLQKIVMSMCNGYQSGNLVPRPQKKWPGTECFHAQIFDYILLETDRKVFQSIRLSSCIRVIAFSSRRAFDQRKEGHSTKSQQLLSLWHPLRPSHCELFLHWWNTARQCLCVIQSILRLPCKPGNCVNVQTVCAKLLIYRRGYEANH